MFGKVSCYVISLISAKPSGACRHVFSIRLRAFELAVHGEAPADKMNHKKHREYEDKDIRNDVLI